MFYVYDVARDPNNQPINVGPRIADDLAARGLETSAADYGEDDVDFVDDSLLNTAPHNKIEKQLLRGDVVGLALMSGAILWSAMGAFG